MLLDVFHISLLKLWQSRDGSEDLPILVTLDNDSLLLEYEVEKILEHRTRKGQKEYLVKWKGWPESNNRWEPEEHLAGAPDVLREYHASADLKEFQAEQTTTTPAQNRSSWMAFPPRRYYSFATHQPLNNQLQKRTNCGDHARTVHTLI
jgi:hypothetical protein